MVDPAGHQRSIPFTATPGGGGGTGTPPPTVGSGNVITDAALDDNRIIRGDGGLNKIQDSLPGVHDDGRITELTDGVNPQDAATIGQLNAIVFGDPAQAWRPLSKGTEPLELISDGDGVPMMVAWNPGVVMGPVVPHASWRPLSKGTEPLELISDGMGIPMMVAWTP